MTSYEDIKRGCLREGSLWEDPDFPAEDNSIFFSRQPPRPFIWKRPKDICSDPHWAVGGTSRLDIQQGMLGDCWLLSAVSSLTLYPSLLNNVLSENTDFDSKDYCGVFRFKLWRNGRWEEVLVDDRLPTYNNKLVFMHSAQKNEFWSPLLEKVFAKLSGSYEALKGGQTVEAMTDMTGGVTEQFNLAKPPKDLYTLMLKAVAKQSLMGCSIESKPNEIESKAPNGLIKGHAYSVTAVAKARVCARGGEHDVELVRVRNPWGNEREWTGAWGDGSPEWRNMSDEEKRDLNLTFDDDGEFWMSYEDFIKNFTKLEMCNLGPETPGSQERRTYKCYQDNGRWVKGSSAGGCRNFINSFASNPQFRMTLKDVDEDDEEDLCTVIVDVMQKDRRKKKKIGGTMLTIGFAIYDIDREEDLKKSRMDKEFFMYNKSTARSPQFINSRDLVGRFKLPPGTYCVIPSTFDPGLEGDFLIRIFTEKEQETMELDEKTEYRPVRPMVSEEAETRENSLDEKFKTFFEKLAGDDEYIDPFELRQILTSSLKQQLSGAELGLETARTLVAKYSTEDVGKLDFEAFKEVWVHIRKVMNVFDKYDTDKSGGFNVYELRGALSSCGYRLSNKVLNIVAIRFGNKKGTIILDDFITCVNKLSTMIEFYNEKLIRNAAGVTLDQFVIATING